MTTSPRPLPSEVPDLYTSYVAKATGDDLVTALRRASDRLWEVVYRLPTGIEVYRYAPGKWNIKEILQHLIDSERVFAYRALRFARNDATELPGFDENAYVPEARVDHRAFHHLLREHDAVRASTIELFSSFDERMFLCSGTANGQRISVRALGWVIAGHAMHHSAVMLERYLGILDARA